MIVKNLSGLKSSLSNRFLLFTQRFQLPEKWKGGRIERWSYFWKGMYLDYKTVCTETIQGAKSKPKKAVCVTSGLGLLYTAVKTNPDEQSFYDTLINNISTLAMVGDPIRNPISEYHIAYLTKCENQGLLRKADLLFFTLIWVADYHRDSDIFAAQCKYLGPDMWTFHQRIIDVGFFDTWLNMRLKMKNFDVNPLEWE